MKKFWMVVPEFDSGLIDHKFRYSSKKKAMAQAEEYNTQYNEVFYVLEAMYVCTSGVSCWCPLEE